MKPAVGSYTEIWPTFAYLAALRRARDERDDARFDELLFGWRVGDDYAYRLALNVEELRELAKVVVP